MVILNKNTLKQLYFLIISFLCFHSVWGQNTHLSQFYTSNLFSNPSLAGKYDGDYRLVANHRNQWRQISGAIVTNIVSLEKRIERHHDAIGLGVLIVNDQVNTLGLQMNKAYLTGAYEKNLGLNLFRGGVQVGMVFKNFNLDGQSFPDQWNYAIGEFDQSITHGEAGLDQAINYLDINLGLGWTRKIGFGTIDLGYALNHLNMPKSDFVGEQQLSLQHTISGQLNAKFGDAFIISPYVFFLTTTGANNMLLGLNVSYKLSDTWKVFAGGATRQTFENPDAAIVMLGLGYSRFEVRFSNDYTMSSLNQGGDNKSAFELSLIYTTPSTKPSKIAIPCERY